MVTQTEFALGVSLDELVARAKTDVEKLQLLASLERERHRLVGELIAGKPALNGTALPAIGRAVEGFCGLHPGEIQRKTHAWRISHPRSLAIWISAEITNATTPEMVSYFGMKHGESIKHAKKIINDRMDTDPAFRAQVAQLREAITQQIIRKDV